MMVMMLDIARRLLEGLPPAEPGEIIPPGVAVTIAAVGVGVAAAAGVLIRRRPDGVMMDVLRHGLAGVRVRVRGRRGWSLGGKHGAMGIQRAQHGWYAMSIPEGRGRNSSQMLHRQGCFFAFFVHFYFVTCRSSLVCRMTDGL